MSHTLYLLPPCAMSITMYPLFRVLADPSIVMYSHPGHCLKHLILGHIFTGNRQCPSVSHAEPQTCLVPAANRKLLPSRAAQTDTAPPGSAPRPATSTAHPRHARRTSPKQRTWRVAGMVDAARIIAGMGKRSWAGCGGWGRVPGLLRWRLLLHSVA
ncbi:hypothetical protein EJ06DRAFT_403651 [Trichodelitschia bisporula]|uniref:Uncharacterized protein n=1 Tax=Trichodelitschia bisporula TaxID=703511 RepID=A0A6G1HXR9_9PEZI|nr:hypothetical protein EJ06DRAFT_403651 [Trichodelitschia bisporula]